MTGKRPKLRSVLGRVALVFAGVAITLAILEIAARALHLGSGAFWEPHPLYGWRNIPNADGWESCYGECAVHVKINSKGLYDREVAYQKAPNERRVLMLGDSVTAGLQVPMEKTFSKVLEQHLHQEATGIKWTVINAGVNAFGTDNELLFFREEASKYGPDVVILGVYLANDVYNNSRELESRLSGTDHKPYFELDENGRLVLMNYPVQGTDTLQIRATTFLKQHLQLPRFLAQVLALRRQVPAVLQPLAQLAAGKRAVRAASDPVDKSERADICTDEYMPIIQDAWTITKALLKQLRSEVEATGAKFAVLVIPASPQVIPPEDGEAWYCEQPNRELQAFLEDERIPYLDLLESFRQHMLQGGAPLYYVRDFHMNEQGHLLAGELLDQFVRERILDQQDY